MKKIQVISEPSGNNRFFLIFGTLLFSFLSIYSAQQAFGNLYFSVVEILIPVFFLVFAFLCLNYWINQTVFKISKQEIVASNKLRTRRISRQDIQGYVEEEYEGKYQSGQKLIFKTKKNLLTIDSNSYSNYTEVVRFVKKHFNEMNEAHLKKYRFQKTIPFRIVFAFVTLLFVGIFVNIQSKDINKLEQNIHYISITLSKAPTIEIESSRKGRKKHYIKFIAVEFPELEFRISGYRYKACNNSFLKKVQKGNTISIGLKTKKNKPLNTNNAKVIAQYFKSQKIHIQQLEYENKQYISLTKVKIKMEENKVWSWFLLVFILGSGYLAFGRIDF